MHECDRVYRDKLVEERDMENYDRIQQDITKKIFEVCACRDLFCCGKTYRICFLDGKNFYESYIFHSDCFCDSAVIGAVSPRFIAT